MVIKKLVALNLALAIMGGVSHIDKTPVVEASAIKESEKSLQSLLFSIEKEEHALKLEQNKIMSEPCVLIEMRLDEKNDYGYDFYEKDTGFETRIFVDTETIEHWGIDDMKINDTIVGILDGNGWELVGFKKY